MTYLEEELDITNNRVREIEKEIAVLQDSIMTLSDQLKETQHFLIKMAHNQSAITKRVTHWPYIPVDTNTQTGED